MEELRGGALARAFPRAPPETRSAKEAKETDGLRWKSPRLSSWGKKGIAVRTKWQSGNGRGNAPDGYLMGNRLNRQREAYPGEIQPVPKP